VSEPLTCLNYIDGHWLPAQSGATLESRNPADWREKVATFPRFGAADVTAAVGAARKADQKWRLVPAPARAEYLYRAGELLLQRKEELATLMSREMGKPLTEARGDVPDGDRLRPLLRCRRPAAVWPDDALGNAGQICYERADAGGSMRLSGQPASAAPLPAELWRQAHLKKRSQSSTTLLTACPPRSTPAT
jgi:hypothetical protein